MLHALVAKCLDACKTEFRGLPSAFLRTIKVGMRWHGVSSLAALWARPRTPPLCQWVGRGAAPVGGTGLCVAIRNLKALQQFQTESR